MRKLLLLPLLLLPLFLANPVQAASCGPGQSHTTCVCGDTVTASYTMTANLSCSSGHGLKIGNNVVLSCAGYTISGVNAQDTYGLYFESSVNSKAKNCVVHDFDKGVRFGSSASSATYNMLRNSTIYHNGRLFSPGAGIGYGVSLDGGSLANWIFDNLIYGNADEGLHIGSGASYNDIDENTSCGNDRESMYVVDANYNSFVNNIIGGDCNGFTGGGTSFYIKNSINTVSKYNTIMAGSLHLTGLSYRNIFLKDVYLNGSTFISNCYNNGPDCPSATITVPVE